MDSINLIESFSDFKEFKNIDRPTMMNVIEGTFRMALLKKYGSDENFDIIINIDKGDLEIWHNREIVPNDFLADDYVESKHIFLSEAKKIDSDFEVGEDITLPVSFSDFGRRIILMIKQSLASKILEIEKGKVYDSYKDRVGDIITSEVYQIQKNKIIFLDEDGNELVLLKKDQIPSDFFRKGDFVKSVISNVSIENGNPVIYLSRTSTIFLEKLLEFDIAEIFDGLITIKSIAREPGEKSKVIVESYDDRIDPVGCCVGAKGSRIQRIIQELNGENIDIINFTNNKNLLINRILNPAKISSLTINEDKSIDVFVESDQIGLAIGKKRVNLRLAEKLLDCTINLFKNSDDTDDVDLDEFIDEIDPWIIDILKKIGCDTAKSVLQLSDIDIIKRTDLEESTVREIRQVLDSEFK